MHKSIMFTFGLLLSSLVMLSAMPLLNNNNIVAMAQGYNDGYNYYSQYPIDDKKYECRTGPFEGFFVSSVEFCLSDQKRPSSDNKSPSSDNKSPSSDNKSPIIKTFNCINANLNGNNTGSINIGNKGLPTTTEEGDLIANAYGNNGEGDNIGNHDDGYTQSKDFSCIINNNNTIITGSGGNETVPPDDGDEKTPLNVIKTVICEPVVTAACTELLTNIVSSNFTIHVGGNGPTPADFDGAAAPGTQVQIGAGLYQVVETIPDTPLGFTLTITFAGDCAPDPVVPQIGTGTIVAGVDQTCEIINTYTNQATVQAGSTGATSSLTAQGTADSHALTAMEKITKLKTQWFNQPQ